MSSNLPPGVHEGMIPGNRPEDEWHEKFMDALKVPDDLVLVMDPGVLASALNVTMGFLGAAHAQAFEAGKREIFEADPKVSFELIRCESVMPDKQIQCDREAGHHGDHHGFLHSSHEETWWSYDEE